METGPLCLPPTSPCSGGETFQAWGSVKASLKRLQKCVWLCVCVCANTLYPPVKYGRCFLGCAHPLGPPWAPLLPSGHLT